MRRDGFIVKVNEAPLKVVVPLLVRVTLNDTELPPLIVAGPIMVTEPCGGEPVSTVTVTVEVEAPPTPVAVRV